MPKLFRILLFYLTAAILYLVILYFLDKKFEVTWKDMLTEAHGGVIDIIIFGIVLTIYELRINKKEDIRRYNEEINDYRSWQAEEAKFRTIGNIRRLNELDYQAIDLSECFLTESTLSNVKLRKAIFTNSNLKSSSITKCRLTNAKFNSTSLQNVVFRHCWCDKTIFYNCDFGSSKLDSSNFDNANFSKSNLEEVEFSGSSTFRNADFTNTNLQNIQLNLEHKEGFSPFDGADFTGATAYINQKEMMSSAGINIDGIHFI